MYEKKLQDYLQVVHTTSYSFECGYNFKLKNAVWTISMAKKNLYVFDGCNFRLKR